MGIVKTYQIKKANLSKLIKYVKNKNKNKK